MGKTLGLSVVIDGNETSYELILKKNTISGELSIGIDKKKEIDIRLLEPSVLGIVGEVVIQEREKRGKELSLEEAYDKLRRVKVQNFRSGDEVLQLLNMEEISNAEYTEEAGIIGRDIFMEVGKVQVQDGEELILVPIDIREIEEEDGVRYEVDHYGGRELIYDKVMDKYEVGRKYVGEVGEEISKYVLSENVMEEIIGHIGDIRACRYEYVSSKQEKVMGFKREDENEIMLK